MRGCSIPKVTLSSSVRVRDLVFCMIRHDAMLLVAKSSMCLLPYRVATEQRSNKNRSNAKENNTVIFQYFFIRQREGSLHKTISLFIFERLKIVAVYWRTVQRKYLPVSLIRIFLP